jgi:D-2-hydroxyacid dehydrogenase (NADP+)
MSVTRPPRDHTTTTVLVAGRETEAFPRRLREALPEVEVVASQSLDARDEQLGRADVLITIGHDATPELLARMPRLRWVQSIITGTDGLQAALRDRPEVLLTSARGIHGSQMSEMAILHMLALTRRIRQLVHNQDLHRWEPFAPPMLDGRTVGILGMGVIGEALARRCHALGMTVVGISRTPRPVEGVDRVEPRARLRDVAPELDFLVLCLPHSAETDRLIGAPVLDAMKPTAYLVNLARGRIVDEAALVQALRTGAIAGAGLDVFEKSPLPQDSPLWDMENVFITPWMAGRSDRYADLAMTIIEPNLRAYLSGDLGRMVNVVER